MSDMRTITFYSYKGGTGRTLALANVARQLARFGQKVVAVDFDLEAPGLHYKFAVGSPPEPPEIERGVVDYIHEFITTDQVPKSVRPYSTLIGEETEQGGRVHLIAAGPVLHGDYWRKLSQIHWRRLLFEPEEAPRGPLAFLEFKEQIRAEFDPDFVLIDSRTGVTEIGGIATGTLADQVICFLINNRENLDGSRMVMRSFRHALRPPGMERLDVDVALSRIPYDLDGDEEAALLDEIREFLNEDAESLEHTLNVDELLVLHSEPSLLTNERLFLASGDGESGLQLYTDYQTLFARLVPDAVIAENVGSLVANAWQHVRDDPDRTQRELQEIAQFGHADAYRELISFYRLRRSNVGVLGHAAFRLWQVTEDGSDPQLWTVVRDMLAQSWYTTPNWPASVSPEFAEDVWRRAGAVSEGEGLVLAEWFREAQDYARAADVLRTIVGTGSPAPDVVASCIDAYVDAGQAAEADDLVQGYRAPYARDHAFAMAWGRHAMDRRDIGSLMDFASLLPDMLNENPPDLAAIELGNKVVKEIGLEDDWRGVLRRRLPALVDTQLPVITMMRYYVAYAEVDLLDAFEQAFEGSPYLDEIQQRVGLGVLRSGRQSPYGAHPVRRK